jgi:phosphomevalonate kinase
MSSTNDNVTVSAPGKVLLAGGYLVLEAPNAGFVVAADKRFYTSVRSGGDDDASTEKKEDDKNKIIIKVDSPQFHSTWNYTYDKSNRRLIPSSDNESVNPFVEKTLRVCLIYLLSSSQQQQQQQQQQCDITSLNILIRADNDFYSVLPHLPSANNRTPADVAALPRFLPCPKDPNTGKAVVHKTGLGSSAALTTSLVGALIHYFRRSQQHQQQHQQEEEEKKSLSAIIHNLAQICHCFAQGKVGSGFDVSAACHGTHVYKRFPKCLLPDLLQQLDEYEKHTNDNEDIEKSKNHHQSLFETLRCSVELVPWKEDMVEALNLPNNLQLILADVRGGSESPSMARTVLKWKAEERNNNNKNKNDENENENNNNEIPHWTTLSKLNPKIVESIRKLTTTQGNDEGAAIDYDTLATIPASEWSSDSPLTSLRNDFLQIRNELRSMGEVAGVPIEPPPQQELCDATSKLAGVITALVPGAGGYDAVACLYIDRPNVVESIGELWSKWNTPIVCPLAVRAGDEGLRLEIE